MNRKEEALLSLSYWVSSLDGSVDVKEESFIKESEKIKPFFSQKNFDYCKNWVKENSEKKDTGLFLKEIINNANFTKEEAKELITHLCYVGSSDGDFDDLEKKYIGYVVAELQLEKESIVDNFEKKYKNTSPQKNKETEDSSLMLDKKTLTLVFNKQKAEVTPIIEKKIKGYIEKKISISDVNLKITDLKIKKTLRLSSNVLIDKREIQEDVEINYTGRSQSRALLKKSIDPFKTLCNKKLPNRADIDFKNISAKTSFRVDDTNETKTCGKCMGLKKVTCYGCSGSGKNRCSSCGGRGDKSCGKCRGGQKYCYSCSGSGTRREYSISQERTVSRRCTSCYGQGYSPCDYCGATGRVRCSRCSGSGQITCSLCRGKGEIKCLKCDAQGSFTYFLKILSTLKNKTNNAFLNDEPDKNFFYKNVHTEEFEYAQLYGKYKFSKLQEHSSELKNLFVAHKFAKSESPKKIKFCLDDCASMSFIINVSGNIYSGGLKSSGELFFDKTILDQLFFSVIKSLDVDPEFKSLKSIKAPIIAKIPEFEETFLKINQYRSLEKIIPNQDSIEDKLNQTRKLKKINTNKFSKHLISQIIKKNQLLSLYVCLASFFALWVFFPLFTTAIVFFFGVTYLFVSISIFSHINDSKKDALKLIRSWLYTFFSCFLIFFATIGFLNGTVGGQSFYNGLNLPYYDPFEFQKNGTFDNFLMTESAIESKQLDEANKNLVITTKGLFDSPDRKITESGLVYRITESDEFYTEDIRTTYNGFVYLARVKYTLLNTAATGTPGTGTPLDGVFFERLDTLKPRIGVDIRNVKDFPNLNMEHGAIIMDSYDAAASAGIERYDIIKKVDGFEVKGADDFVDYIETKKIGEQINVEVLRKNKTILFKPILSKSSGIFSHRFVLRGDSTRSNELVIGTQAMFNAGEEGLFGMVGLEEALSIMKIGEKASFIFPSDLALGNKSIGDLPSNSNLFVEIHLPRQFLLVRDSKDFSERLNTFINRSQVSYPHEQKYNVNMAYDYFSYPDDWVRKNKD